MIGVSRRGIAAVFFSGSAILSSNLQFNFNEAAVSDCLTMLIPAHSPPTNALTTAISIVSSHPACMPKLPISFTSPAPIPPIM